MTGKFEKGFNKMEGRTETPTPEGVEIPAGYILKREKVTERVSLLMRRSFYCRLEEIRVEQGKKRNEFINDILEEYIKKYDEEHK